MSIRLYTGLRQLLQIYRLLIPVVLIVGLAVLIGALGGVVSTFILLLFIIIVLAPMVMTAFYPVRCMRMGCTGRMEVTSRRLSFWTVALIFTCNQCGIVNETKIFNPDVEITVEASF